MIKDTDDHPKRKDAKHKAWEKEHRGFMLSADSPHSVVLCVQQCRSSPNPTLGDFYGGLITQAYLIINSISSLSPFLEDEE